MPAELRGSMRVAERYLTQGACQGAEVAVADHTGLRGGFRIGRAGYGEFPLWTCAGKSLLTVCVAALVGRRMLSFTDRIVTYLPELDTGLWHDVRLCDLLSHSVALRHDPAAWAVFRDDDEVLRRLRSAVPATPGSGGVYLRWTNFFLVGQVITRVAGQSWDTYVQRHVMDPLMLRDTRLRFPAAALGELEWFVRSLVQLDGSHPAADPSMPDPSMPDSSMTVRADRSWPGMSASGPMSDLVRVLAVLLPGENPLAIPPSVISEVTTVRNQNTGAIEGNPLNWGLGVMVDRRIASSRFTAETFGYFGHNGTVVGFADPARGLSFAVALRGPRTKGGLSLPLRRAAIIHAILDDLPTLNDVPALDDVPAAGSDGPR